MDTITSALRTPVVETAADGSGETYRDVSTVRVDSGRWFLVADYRHPGFPRNRWQQLQTYAAVEVFISNIYTPFSVDSEPIRKLCELAGIDIPETQSRPPFAPIGT